MRGAGGREVFGAERAAAVGIAHVREALAIGRLQRQCIFGVGRCIRAVASALQLLLQQAQRMRQRRPGGEFGRRVNVSAAIGDLQRLAQMGAEAGKIFDRQRAAGGLNVGRDAAREVALVEITRALGGEMRHRRLECALRHPHRRLDTPFRIGRQAVLQIGRRARRVTPEVRSRTRNHQRGPPIHQQAFAGEGNAGSQQFLPRHFGVTAMRLLHAGDHAGHGDRCGALKVAIVLHPRPRKNVGGRTRGQRIVLDAQAVRRAHAVVDHLVAVFAGAIEHHCAAAASAAHPGLQHTERKGGGDDGIDAVAAGCQHPGADLGGFSRLRGDDAALGSHRGLADLLGIGELVGHVWPCCFLFSCSATACCQRSGVNRTGSLRIACTKLFGATSIPPAYSISGSRVSNWR